MKIIAHRGFSYSYPESSKLAYQRAIEVGADGLECDVRLTRDGVAICFHDRTTKRIASKKLVVSKESYDSLLKVTEILKLTELLELAIDSGRELLIETKHPVRTGAKVEEILLKILDKRQAEIPITLISFSLLATKRIMRSYPSVGYVISRAWRAFVIPTHVVAVDIELYRRSRFVRQRLQGREVLLWTVNDPEDLKRALEWQVAGVITDRPDLAREVIAGTYS